MIPRRGMAVASALLSAALATAGCGLGPGADVGSVELTVTREYGAVPMLERSVSVKESDTVLRVLEAEVEIETRYGGGFVHAIDGVAERERGGDPYDWFFYVDGVEAPVGGGEYELEGDERVWWDYRNWSATNHVPAVVGSWPAPFSHGIGGRRQPVVLECEGGGDACAVARAALEREGVDISLGDPDGAIRMLVGPWGRLRKDPAARLIEDGPAESGVFADFVAAGPASSRGSDTSEVSDPRLDGRFELVALDEGGEEADRLGPGAGLVAATSRYGGLPVWVVTGGTPAAVARAADSLDPEVLGNRFAVASAGALLYPLPLEGP